MHIFILFALNGSSDLKCRFVHKVSMVVSATGRLLYHLTAMCSDTGYFVSSEPLWPYL
jgi:hypothetical protein